MILKSSTELSEIIKELSALLDEGCKLQEDYIRNDRRSFKKKILVWKAFPEYKKFKYEITIWVTKVTEKLNYYFPQSHYVIHFSHTPEEAKKIPDVSYHISILGVKLQSHIEALEDIIWRLDEKEDVIIRKEIADIEFQADILYQITYNYHNRKIYLNDMFLVKPDFNSENDNCFQYIYSHPKKRITVEDLRIANGGELKKEPKEIINDLKFTGVLKDIFFPGISKDSLTFVNPITREYAIENKIPEINLFEFSRNRETKRDKVRKK